MRKIANEELKRISVDEFKTAPKNPIILILDNIRSMHNVGSAFRTADAFRAERIILGGITARPPHREIQKTALGATDSVTWEYHPNLLEKIQQLKQESWKIIAIEQAQESTSLEKYQFQLAEKYAFIFGNEVFGVSDELMQIVDDCLEIPQFGTKHSLNVSVSIGVILWDYFSKKADNFDK